MAARFYAHFIDVTAPHMCMGDSDVILYTIVYNSKCRTMEVYHVSSVTSVTVTS